MMNLITLFFITLSVGQPATKNDEAAVKALVDRAIESSVFCPSRNCAYAARTAIRLLNQATWPGDGCGDYTYGADLLADYLKGSIDVSHIRMSRTVDLFGLTIAAPDKPNHYMLIRRDAGQDSTSRRAVQLSCPIPSIENPSYHALPALLRAPGKVCGPNQPSVSHQVLNVLRALEDLDPPIEAQCVRLGGAEVQCRVEVVSRRNIHGATPATFSGELPAQYLAIQFVAYFKALVMEIDSPPFTRWKLTEVQCNPLP